MSDNKIPQNPKDVLLEEYKKLLIDSTLCIANEANSIGDHWEILEQIQEDYMERIYFVAYQNKLSKSS
tara:strand:- start:168 stop:371 length:204 start_codon:yes stop_codon:yes gene_type:complete